MGYISLMPTAFRDMPPWRRYLAEHGLTLRWLAEQTGVSEASVRAYSRGGRRPSLQWLLRVDEVIRQREDAA